MKPDRPKYIAPLPWGSPGGQPHPKPIASTRTPVETMPMAQGDEGQNPETPGQLEPLQALDAEKNKFFATISVLILLGIVLSAWGYDGAPRSSGAVIVAILGSLVLALSWLLIMAFVLFGTQLWAKQCCKWGSQILAAIVLIGSLPTLNTVGLAWAALLIWQASVIDKDLKSLP